MELEQILPALGALVLGSIVLVITATFGQKRSGGKISTPKAPKDPTVDVAKAIVEEEFEEEIEEIKKAAKSDSPAKELAAKGRSRKRKAKK